MPLRWNLPYLELALASRLFAFLVLGAPVLWSRDPHALLGLAAVGVVWFVSSVLIPFGLPPAVLGLVEAGGIGLVVGWFAPDMPSLLPALAFPMLSAGLWRGLRGVLESSVLTGLTTLATLTCTTSHVETALLASACTWLLSGVGVGLLTATFVRVTGRNVPDPSEPYREARALIRDLTRLSTHLSGGLNAAALAGDLLDRVGAEVPAGALHVHGVRPHGLVLLASRTTDSPTPDGAPLPLADRAAKSGVAVFRDGAFAVPVSTRGVTVAVVSGRLGTDDASTRSAVKRRVVALEPLAVRLDTALMFSELRAAAGAGERNRLAREIHDGVAQEIASMGYLVDALAADAPDRLRGDLLALRASITSVVAEVRRSVTTLRTEVGSQESLGAGIAALARHLSESSGIPIAVTVDERTDRLRPEVEAEILRIAQEAMTNAVKHARPAQIDVVCRVASPSATLTVRDDGVGLGCGRPDSHGLTIMSERAALIGADLSVRANSTGGTTVHLVLGRAIAVPVPVPSHSPVPEEQLL